MYEFLLSALPEAAQACRRLYDVRSGGYHLPLREHNTPLRLADVERWRAAYPTALFDCVETPVADLLYALVVNTRSRWVLETGTSRGFSTSHLAAGAQFVGGDTARVLTIDFAPAPHPFFADSAVSPSITAIRADSLTVDLRPLMGETKFDFMFFDSLHTYAHLSGELARFLPHLKAGGLFALHDTMVYDDLGLVVTWLTRSGVVETVSLPTHRTHGERSRSPGVTLFRKIARIDFGDLVFPDLEGVVDGERQSVLKPDLIVQRTGALFLDPRYAAGGLHRNGPRDDSSPALLECAEALREQETSASDDWQSRLPAFAKLHSSVADLPSPSLHRHRTVNGADRKAQAEWWRLHGDIETRLFGMLPAPFGSASQRRLVERVGTALDAADDVVLVACRAGTEPSVLQTALDHATTRPARRVRTVAVEPWLDRHTVLPSAGAYVVDGVLNHLSAFEIAAFVARLREAAPAGARIVVLEPVCFPGHRPDERDDALVRSIHALLQSARQSIDHERIVFSTGVRQVRSLMGRRWWGRLPCGPAPLQRPFAGAELARIVGQQFTVERAEIMQVLLAQELGRDLRLLADDAPGLAGRLAGELMPALEELEAVILARDPPPDVSWYRSMVVAAA